MSSSSSSPSSSSSSSSRSKFEVIALSSSGSLSSSGASPVNEKATQTLKVMKSLHDFDSIVTMTLLGRVRDHYSIPTEYKLYAPRPGQRAHDPFVDGFGLMLDALEVGLRFPLHLVIKACLSW